MHRLKRRFPVENLLASILDASAMAFCFSIKGSDHNFGPARKEERIGHQVLFARRAALHSGAMSANNP